MLYLVRYLINQCGCENADQRDGNLPDRGKLPGQFGGPGVLHLLHLEELAPDPEGSPTDGHVLAE